MLCEPPERRYELPMLPGEQNLSIEASQLSAQQVDATATGHV